MRVVLALSLSLAIHLGVLSYLSYHKKDEVKIERQKPSTTHINFVKLIQNTKQKIPKKIVNNQPIKEIFQKKIQPLQTPPKIIELPKETKIFELPPKIVQQEPIIQKIIEQPTIKPLSKEIPQTESKKIEEPKFPQHNVDNITKSYLALYEKDFDTFPETTKIYLIKNLKDIGKITQRFLIYPHLSIQAKQSGINVVEFILHPNGKISEPKIIKSSKYYILDDNSIETINEAYRDYPRPDKPTIIRIYVKYELI